MANKTIYIREDDLAMFERAQAGGESISAVVSRALRSYLEAEERASRVQEERRGVEDEARALLRDAVIARASDLHFEPGRGRGRVRIRVDGVLRELRAVSEELFEPIVTYLLSISQLEGGLPFPSGRLSIDLGDLKRSRRRKELPEPGREDFCICVLPSIRGRSLTLRRLPTDLEIPTPGELEPDSKHGPALEALMERSHGLIISTGPTGSGKTTTLYSLLRSIDREQRKLFTVESPVDLVLDSCVQIPVGTGDGFGFQEALQGVLRCDPDVVMVGEIRDGETAQRCLEMALTGHLVLLVLHAPTAASAIRRLVELGLDPLMLREALVGVIGNRLVRRLCAGCRELGDGSPRAPGCERCDGTGFRGRLPLFEILTMSTEVRAAMTANASLEELETAARAGGMEPLAEDGREKAAAGWTTVAEAAAATAH